jgi:hypothetical protein
MVLTASTTDKGASGLPPLKGSAEVLLRSRRQRAACFDRSEKAVAQDNLDQGGLVARIQADGWIAFERIRLQDFRRIKLSAWPQGSAPLIVSILAGDRELARQELPAGAAASQRPTDFLFAMPPADPNTAPQPVRVRLDRPADSVLDVMWIEFLRD